VLVHPGLAFPAVARQSVTQVIAAKSNVTDGNGVAAHEPADLRGLRLCGADQMRRADRVVLERRSSGGGESWKQARDGPSA